jgi:PAS domain S-box-containing protein
MISWLRDEFVSIKKNPLGVTLLSYAVVVVIGLLDFFTNPEFSFSVFYLIPISINTWFLNRRSGIYISAISAIVWLYVDVSSAPPYENFIAPYWNSAIRLGFFVIVVLLLTEVKYLYLHLEKLVIERTAELTDEIKKKNAAEAELTRSKNLYQDLVENINEVYYTTDEKGNFIYVSPNFYKLIGVEESKVTGNSFYSIIDPEDRERIKRYYSSRFASVNNEASCEFRIIGKDNSGKWFEQNSGIIYNEKKPVEIRNLLREITERKAAEISLIKSEMRFKRLFNEEEDKSSEKEYVNNLLFSDPAYIIRSLAEKIDEITDKMSSRVKQAIGFSSLASHELRTPLAIIRNQLEENLRDDTTEYHLRAATASIYDEVLRLQRIIDDLLKLSRMEAGNFTLKKENVCLDEFLRHFYGEAKLLAQDKNVDVKLCDLLPAIAEIDTAYFLQMLFNILDNALKYTRPEGRIIIGYNLINGKAEIFLKDSGTGIPQVVINRLFTPFYPDKSDNLPSGTGLGLIISRWIAELHDGSINIYSKPGEGTEVVISIPVIRIT